MALHLPLIKMDIHTALATLLRPMPHPLTASFAPSLLALSHLDQQPLLNLAQIPDHSISPHKKARMEDSSSPLSSSTVSSSQHSTSPIASPRRKMAQPIPEEKKDVAYFERRRKNNDAAKRSRDLRRQKEEATSLRAAQLEQENAQLRGQLALMKSEMARIQLLLLSRVAGAPTTVKTENISV